MANCTVTGNKTTKELKKGVSMMKKSCFKVLCMVLIIALLAPNVFAAAPAPEVPLADAATVARVKQEIAAGEITDMEDLLLVACQYFGADLEEEGITAYINEDGTLGFTQIISAEKKMTRGNQVWDVTFASSTLAFVDEEGAVINSTAFYPLPQSMSEIVDGTNVSIIHTAYFDGRVTGDVDDVYSLWEVRISYMITSINNSGTSNYVTKLVQKYQHFSEWRITEQDSKTTTGVLNGSYTFTPGIRSWHDACEGEDNNSIVTTSTVYISGIADPVSIEVHTLLHDQIPIYIM